ncbi:MAG: zinc-binding dehydrogenase [Caldilineaceae bacterium]|nr:zinc-binding dehydrogenase [Caldilineaceae bacterium]
MRAIVFTEHSPSVDAYQLVDDLPVPTPKADEVLVRVRYAALNRLDNFVRIGWKGLTLAFPHIPCADFSGEIAAVGEGVQGWAVGQRVTANPLLWCGRCPACVRGEQQRCEHFDILGEHTRGACADYVVIPARNLVAIPPGYAMPQAAAASLVYLTAWHSLIVAGQLRPGEQVLIVGAGGGVNTAALQIAKLMGATVYVIASNTAKAVQAQAEGADWVHDRSAEPHWAKAVYLATGKSGVDLVVDNVGAATFPSSLRSLRAGGRLVTVGGTAGYEATVPVNLLFGKHLSIIGSTMGSQADYGRVMDFVFRGKLQPVVDSVYPMAEFRTAMTRMIENQQFGKILIEVKRVAVLPNAQSVRLSLPDR